MMMRFIGPVVLLCGLIAGDQIRINRPDHKYRLSLEVETPQGLKSAAGVFSVHPDRSYSRRGRTRTKGDAIVVDVTDTKRLVVLMAHRADNGSLDLDDINYVAVRGFKAAGQRAVFRQMDRLVGTAPVTGSLVPLLVSFDNAADVGTLRTVDPEALAASFGAGVRLHVMTVTIVPNGFWPLDFGGPLGEPVTRGIFHRLSWTDSDAAARAVQAVGLMLPADANARDAFTR